MKGGSTKGRVWVMMRPARSAVGSNQLKKISSALRTAMIDRNLLDYRSYRTFIRTRRAKMAEKLREITDLTPKSLAFLAKRAEDAAE